MGFVDGHQTSGAPKLSCNSLSLVLTFFSDSDGLNVCQRAPFRVRGFPRAGSKCGYQQSRQSTRSAIRVAFGSCPGVVASPVATASVSERARSVRPEQLSVLRSTLSKRQRPGASRSFPAEEVQKDKIQGRAPHPGKSRLRAAVKAEWARWSDCHLSWPSMPIPGAVAALGMPRNRGGQVPEATDFPRTYQLTSRSAARRCVAARSSASRGEHRVSSLLLAVTPGLPGMTQ
ncbi:uncharacterized protein [Agelaius tricolor]|uniref:uncharacterized protein isoform X8 n=1 Tax=Agelaius tricolor TaxID=9191 RepID=UPI0039F1D158